MKIIKQLSEDEFVIKMEECDLMKEKRIIVAHDYVQFNVNMGIQTSSDVTKPIYGKYAFCNNWINAMFDVQLDIRDMVKFILPFLNKHKYCTEEHIKDNYYGKSIIFFTENDEKKVAIKGDKDDDFTIVPLSVYNMIKNDN